MPSSAATYSSSLLSGRHLAPGSEQAASQADAQARARKNKKAITSFLIKLGVFVAAVWAMFTFVLCAYRMSGEAMYPRIRDGDFVVAYRLDRDFVVGDVVTYMVNGRRHTARIAAQGGDVVEISDNGLFLVNGNPETDQVFFETNEISGGITYPYTVEEGSYFLLADYRTSAVDSRDYGAIAGSEFEGKVIAIFRGRGI